MRPVKSAASHKNVVRAFTQSLITTNSAHAAKRKRETKMEFHIEFYNTAASIAWAFVTFLVAGMFINRKRGK